MPEKVSGNLTVTLKYNLEKAFGIGKVTYYLPQLDDTTWSESKNSYSFWQGRGYLKAEQVDNSGATISLYKSDQVKLATLRLQPGETSNNIYIPGFYCKAALQARLDGMALPETTARLVVDGDEISVRKGESFLGSDGTLDTTGAVNTGKCTLNSIDKQGIIQKIGINCQADDGYSSFGLNVNPKISLEIDGVVKDYKVGDYLFEYTDTQGGLKVLGGTKYAYLGYIGANGNTNDIKNLYVYFVGIPSQSANSNSLPQTDIDLIASVANKENSGPVSKANKVNVAFNFLTNGLAGLQKVSAYLVKGTSSGKLSFNEGRQPIFSHTIKLVGFAGAVDYPLTGATKTNFDSSMADYKRVISNFANEKRDTQMETYGESA
jgi:hypothetical protein